MATYDRTYGTVPARDIADTRLDRPTHLDWSALFGGALIGWGALLVFSLLGMAFGYSVIDPFTARPAVSNEGAALFGAVSAVLSAFIGGFAVVKLAGDRRRGESLAHGGVSWGLSMLAGGLLALFAAGAAPMTRTPVRNTDLNRNVKGQHAALVETTGNGGNLALFSLGGAVLALGAALLGSLAAASKTSGVPFSREFNLRPHQKAGAHKDSILMTDVRRDQTTILPPTH